MAHGVSRVIESSGKSTAITSAACQKKPSAGGNTTYGVVGVMGSRRIFPPAFKLKVLDSYRSDAECRGNQRATARKYGIHRRQIQKWLQCEENLRKGCQAAASVVVATSSPPESPSGRNVIVESETMALNEQQREATAPCKAEEAEEQWVGKKEHELEEDEEEEEIEEEGEERRSPAPVDALATIAPHHHYLHLYQQQQPHRDDDCSSSASCSGASDSDAETLEGGASNCGSSCSSSGASSGKQRRRSFSLRFKLDVLDAFHGDAEVAGNQRATAKKFGINRRQVQKWLGQELVLRDEIALRGGNARQRLAPLAPSSSPPPCSPPPVDLRTRPTPDSAEAPFCNLSCCNFGNGFFTGKRPLCTLSCCTAAYEDQACCWPPAKRLREDHEPPQEAPLCLVLPKLLAVPSPPPPRDAILFKPYLDNPVQSKSNNNTGIARNLNDALEARQRPPTPPSAYALKLDLRLPPLNLAWTPAQQPQQHHQQHLYKSAFVRYPPATPHYV